MTMELWTMYHVTPSYNVPSILTEGIQPRYSEGKREASYYVTRNAIEWAILYVSAKRYLHVSELTVFTVEIPRYQLARCNHIHMYYTKGIFRPVNSNYAVSFINNLEEVQSDYE